jgi:hypothetical protein
VSDEGRHIEPRFVHSENADSPSAESLEGDSKVTLERLWQTEKHRAAIVSTAEGMRIDPSDTQQLNADLPKTEAREPHPNVTADSDRQ